MHKTMHGPGTAGAARWVAVVLCPQCPARWGHLLQETPQEVAQVQPRGRTRAATSGFSAVRFSPNITTTFGCSIPRLLNGRGWAEAMQMSLGTQGVSLEFMAHW